MNKYKLRELFKQIISQDRFNELEREDKSIGQIFLLLGKIISEFLLSLGWSLYQLLERMIQTLIFIGKVIRELFTKKPEQLIEAKK